MLRPLKEVAKALIRAGVRWRLHTFPVSQTSGERWEKRIKNWPAILNDSDIRRRIHLSHSVQMDVGLVDVIERSLWTTGEWDVSVRHVLETVLRPGDAFLDLGANIGYFTMIASRLVGPTGTVIAVEPSIRALRKLTHHLDLNRCDNVILLSLAAGNAVRRESMTLATCSNIGASALRQDERLGNRCESVLMAPMDQLVKLDSKLRLIKVDLEGCELLALQGAEQLIRQHRPTVVCEVTERFLNRFGHSAGELIQFFADLNYEWTGVALNGEVSHSVPQQWHDSDQQFDVIFSPRNPEE